MTVARRRAHAAPARPAGFDAEAGARGNTWERSCAGKDRYTSEAAALVGIGLNTRASTLDAYACGYCGCWHLTERRPAGKPKAPPVYLLAFVCSRCQARHATVAASDHPWTERSRRQALLKLEPVAMRDGWSIGLEDHCPGCAAALGLETMRGAA